ncbi:MAG: hypothetical protein WCA46_03410 [Actinocatenispora sp.]
MKPLVDLRFHSDRQTGVLDQLVLAELIRGGGYDRHVRRSRARYRRRRDALLGVLQTGHTASGIAAGLHVVVSLPPGRTEAEVLDAAARRGVGVDAMARHHRSPGPHPQRLIVGYGAPPDHAFPAALREFRAVLG